MFDFYHPKPAISTVRDSSVKKNELKIYKLIKKNQARILGLILT